MEKFDCLGLEKNRGRFDKKRKLGQLIINRRSNKTQLIAHRGASNKRLILFKLFLAKSKNINLVFLLANLLYFPITFMGF